MAPDAIQPRSMMTPAWRTRIFAACGAVLAVVMGAAIAQEAFLWPAVVAGALVTVMIIYVQPLPLPTLLLGAAAVGYIVGNRGFAQLYLAGAFPLLPAELVLVVGIAVTFVQSAWRREIPFERNLINAALLLWMTLGTLRFLLDVRFHGFTAVRDFALVYYGLFFFLVQRFASHAQSRRFLQQCVLGGCVALLVVHPLFTQFQTFFLQTLTVRGMPLIYFKGDLAGNFMALGSLLAFTRFEEARRFRWLLVSLALAGLMLTTNSRSSMVGLAVGAGWLAVSGRWKFTGVLGLSAALTALVFVAVTYFRNASWEQTPVYSLYERVASIIDPLGRRAYVTEDMLSKSDNNTFRIVWWRASIDETVQTNPWFGLGFGHDLAQRFVRDYYPEGNDDFSARSPHNVLITTFARMGFVGLASFLILMMAMAVRTWRVLRDNDAYLRAGAWWCGAWVLLSCAFFGVVLEGPMGAVVFWTVLGLASACSAKPETEFQENPDVYDPTVIQHRQTPQPALSVNSLIP